MKGFDLKQKIVCLEMNIQLCVICVTDVNVKYLQENGFKNPLLVKDKTGLGIRSVGLIEA